MNEDREFLRCGRAGASAGGPNIKGALLGRVPRYAPDRDFDTRHVALDLRIDFAGRAVAGSCRTTIRAFRDGLRRLEFDAVGLRVTSASVDGAPARFSLGGGKLTLRPRRPLRRGADVEVLVRYRAVKPRAGLHFVYPGPHNPGNPVQVWSQSQPEDARHWFPCHDDPRQKASSELRATVPRGFRVISNGTLAGVSRSGRSETYHWKMRRPHSIYLISLAAGRFAEIAERWEDIPVTYYCEKGREEDARRGFSKTPKVIEFFSKATGVRYPYEKYAQVAVAEYPGGMEHTTCTTQTDAVLIDKRAALDTDLDLLVAHELAHQWFGDLVTCRDWSHAWLNEGFATYFEILFQEHDKGADEADYELWRNARSYFDEDSRRYRRPIVSANFKEPWTLFDRHTYEKGGWVLRMLREELGDALWWKAINHYLTKFRDQSVETQDLISAIAEATGRNVQPFFDQWVYKCGYPQFRIQYDWDSRRRRAGLWVLQTQAVGEDSPLFKTSPKIRFYGRGWVRTFAEKLSEKEHRLSYRLPSEPVNVEFDPEHRLLMRASMAKPQRMWRHQLVSAPSAQSRHEAAEEVARWGDRAAVDLLDRAIRREPFWGAAAEMAGLLGSVRTDAAFERLKSLAQRAEPRVRRAVVSALGRLRRSDASALLARLARRDPSVHVEAEASRALGALRDERWLSLLRRQLAKRSYRDAVGAGAVAGLAATRSASALADLRRASRPGRPFARRVAALRALGDYAAVSTEAVPWICALAADPDERITLAAVGVLGQVEDGRALPALEKARLSPNSRVRVYAEEAIARIRAGVERKTKG